tara:strand:- start:1208 stop:1768 length:561 start_codon:yes stop_codon:yes gene_type:complete
MNKKNIKQKSKKTKSKKTRSKKTKSKNDIPKKYLPNKLSSKDRKKQKNMLIRSRKAYKKGKYISRSPVRSYISKTSSHIINAKKIYNIDTIYPSKKLSIKTGCSEKSLTDIVNKGKGAYFSGGSRPNQTASSWGYARLASAITGGKSAAVDFHILEKGCKKGSKALKLAKKSKKKHGKGTRKVPKA